MHNEATTVDYVNESPSALKMSASMRDPSDLERERSRCFNAFFGLFFASVGLYFGYGLALLAPLGEKWLKYYFGVTEHAALFLGMANGC